MGLLMKLQFAFQVCLPSSRGMLEVCFASGRGPSGSALADSDQTLKANQRSGLGLLSVRLGPVGTVIMLRFNISCLVCRGQK